MEQDAQIAFVPYWAMTLTIPLWGRPARDASLKQKFYRWLRAMNERQARRAGLAKPEQYKRIFVHSYFSYFVVLDRTLDAVHAHVATGQAMNQADAIELWQWQSYVHPIRKVDGWIGYMAGNHPYGEILKPWVRHSEQRSSSHPSDEDRPVYSFRAEPLTLSE